MIHVRKIVILVILRITDLLTGGSNYTLIYPDRTLERMMVDTIHIMLPIIVKIYILFSDL